MGNRTPTCDPAVVAQRLEALSRREYVSEDYVRFRIELLKAQTEVREALARSAAPQPLSGPDAEKEARSPPLGANDVPFDRALLGKLFEDLAAALRSRGPRSEDISRLFAAVAKDRVVLGELVRKAAFGPDDAFLASLAKHFGVSPEDLLFLGRALAAPFVAEAVRRLKEHGRVAAPEGLGCPYCGSSPGLAKLRREEGRRILFCSLCGESWEFARVACPFCGSGRALGMLSTGTADPRWIETCEQCKGYLKTTDERRLPEGEAIVPLVEATATLYLDLIAEQEGFARGLPYAALR
jgi:formate dehydrogenase accessory protein FdhE